MADNFAGKGRTFRDLQESVKQTIQLQAQTAGGITQLMSQMSRFD